MKTKELPLSLLRAWRLKRKSPEALGGASEPLPGRVVVSMTSIESRLGVVDLAVRSLLDQTARPDRIVLWLGDGLRGNIPESVQGLVGERFEIRYRLDTGPHTKLVHALLEFPHHAVVTADDDHLYPRDWLERLWNAHLAYPDEVIANECRRIARAPDGSFLPYSQWPLEQPGVSHADTLALGYAGVLYPADTLHADATDHRLYRDLAPRADDLWFKAMSLLFGTRTRRSPDPSRRPLPIAGSQEEALGQTNIDQDGNREQWLRVAAHYGLDVED